MSIDITDPEHVTKLTNQAIPVDPLNPIQISEIKNIGTWQHDTVAYDSIWDAGESIPLVLRFYRSPLTYWQTNDTSKRDREWAVQRRLRLDGLPVPRPIARGESEAGAYIIWRLPLGQGWASLEQRNAADARPIVPQLAEFMSRLHSMNHNSLNSEPLYQATVAGTLVRMLLWSREMSNEELRQMIARLKPAVTQLQSWRPRLLHGNPHVGNLITNDDRILAVLNWENAAIGDPRWDVMTSAHWLRQGDVEASERLINWYETFTGKTIDNRPFWWAMISVRLWALKSWTLHATKQSIIPEDLATWADDLQIAQDRAYSDLTLAGL